MQTFNLHGFCCCSTESVTLSKNALLFWRDLASSWKHRKPRRELWETCGSQGMQMGYKAWQQPPVGSTTHSSKNGICLSCMFFISVLPYLVASPAEGLCCGWGRRWHPSGCQVQPGALELAGWRGSLGSVKKDTCKSHPKWEKLRENKVLERGKDVPKITQQGSRGTENRSSSQPWAQHPPDLQASPLISRAFRKETKVCWCQKSNTWDELAVSLLYCSVIRVCSRVGALSFHPSRQCTHCYSLWLPSCMTQRWKMVLIHLH